MNLNTIALRHHKWVEQMNWHNRTHLEAAGMIASEIGEVCGETHLTGITDRFAEEVADVILRVLDEAVVLGISIDDAVSRLSDQTIAYESLERSLIRMTTRIAPLVNAARQSDFVKLEHALAGIVKHCLELDARLSLKLEQKIEQKMAKNLLAGKRGRLI